MRTVGALQKAVTEQDAVIDDIKTCGVGSSEDLHERRKQSQQSRIANAAPLLQTFAAGEAPLGTTATLKAYAQKVHAEVLEHESKHKGNWRVSMALQQSIAEPVRDEGSGSTKKHARHCAAEDVLRKLAA